MTHLQNWKCIEYLVTKSFWLIRSFSPMLNIHFKPDSKNQNSKFHFTTWDRCDCERAEYLVCLTFPWIPLIWLASLLHGHFLFALLFLSSPNSWKRWGLGHGCWQHATCPSAVPILSFQTLCPWIIRILLLAGLLDCFPACYKLLRPEEL